MMLAHVLVPQYLLSEYLHMLQRRDRRTLNFVLSTQAALDRRIAKHYAGQETWMLQPNDPLQPQRSATDLQLKRVSRYKLVIRSQSDIYMLKDS